MLVLTMRHNQKARVGDTLIKAYRDERGSWTINGERGFLRFPEGTAAMLRVGSGKIRVGITAPNAKIWREF